jgi:23S rRNA pseudouridine2605 synthase
LLLLTNDGDFTNLISGTKLAAKVYEVKVKGKPSGRQIAMLGRGVTVDGKRTAPAVIRLMEESASNAWYRVTLYEGRNQQIRKMFDHIGHSVIKLRRVEIGFLKKERLKPGEYRLLSEAEVRRFFRSSKKH